MRDHKTLVVENEQVADSIFIMRLSAEELSSEISGGQFVHMQIPGLDSHILRRPFSVYDSDPAEGTIDILYQIVGCGTKYMATWQAGLAVKMIGPAGNGWSIPKGAERALLVGGGVGAAPLLMLCKALMRNSISTDVVLGSSTKSNLVCLERYADISERAPMCSTDDGSFGEEGFCTALAKRAIENALSEGRPYDYMAVCGPEPVMRIASSYGRKARIPTEVSLERRMACGIGACLSCVVDTKEGLARVCADGPIFDAEEVIW